MNNLREQCITDRTMTVSNSSINMHYYYLTLDILSYTFQNKLQEDELEHVAWYELSIMLPASLRL